MALNGRTAHAVVVLGVPRLPFRFSAHSVCAESLKSGTRVQRDRARGKAAKKKGRPGEDQPKTARFEINAKRRLGSQILT